MRDKLRVMVLRRLGAFGASLMMFQLAFAGGELACPSRGDDHAPPVQQVAPVAEHHHGHEGSSTAATQVQHEPTDHEHGDHGTMPPCCQAMNACSSGIALQPASETLVAVLVHAPKLVLATSNLVSRVEAPDPPPPKA